MLTILSPFYTTRCRWILPSPLAIINFYPCPSCLCSDKTLQVRIPQYFYSFYFIFALYHNPKIKSQCDKHFVGDFPLPYFIAELQSSYSSLILLIIFSVLPSSFSSRRLACPFSSPSCRPSSLSSPLSCPSCLSYLSSLSFPSWAQPSSL